MTDPERVYIAAEDPGMGVEDNVRISKYDVRPMRDRYPRWDSLPKDRRKELLTGEAEPVAVDTTHNITTEYFWSYIARLLNDRNDYDRVVDPPAHIVFADDPGPFSLGDSEFTAGSDLGRVVLTDPRNVANEWRANELVGALELNGKTLESLAIETESGEYWNLTELPDAAEVDQKTSEEALVVEVILPVNDASYS